MRLLSRLPLRALLTVPFIGLVMLLVLVIGLLSYRAGSQALDMWSEQLLVETVTRIEQSVTHHVSGSGAVLEAAFPVDLAGPALIADNVAALRSRFWAATAIHRDLNNYAYYGDRDGHFFGLYRHQGDAAELRLRGDGHSPRQIFPFRGIDGPLGTPTLEKRIFEPRERPWYRAAEALPGHVWTPVYLDFRTLELVATRARRVMDREGRLRGVVATDVSLRSLNEIVSKLKISENGVALIAEPDGSLIGVSRGNYLEETSDGTKRRMSAKNSPDPLVAATFRAVSEMSAESAGGAARAADIEMPNGDIVQVGYSRMRDGAGLDWVVMVAVPRNDFVQRVRASFTQSLWLGALAALLVALIGSLVLRTIVGELRALADAAHKIGRGETWIPPASARRDELGDLARSFVEMQARLSTDQLTGLSNRAAAVKRIGDRIRHQRRGRDARPFALLFIDADRFKSINDQLGHDVGDRMLQELGQRIRHAVRTTDLVARYAGDEFLVLIDDVASRDEGERLRAAMEARLREPVNWLPPEQAKLTGSGASIGLAIFPEDGDDVDTLVRVADHDMYRRKTNRPCLETVPMPD